MKDARIRCDGCGKPPAPGEDKWVSFQLIDPATAEREGDEVHLCPECKRGPVAAVGAVIAKRPV